MKQILRTMAISAVLALSLAGCTGNPLTSPGGVLGNGTTPGGTAGAPGTTTTTTTPSGTTTTTTTPSGATKGRQTATGTCTSTSPAATPDVLTGSAYGSFAGQHVPNGWSTAYATQKQVWDAINTTPDATWACFPTFYPGAYKVYNDLSGTSGN